MSSVAAVRAGAPRPRVLRLALAAVAALGVLWLVARVAAGPLLAVRSVQVTGDSPLPEAEVVAASGIDLGDPLISLDVAAVRARLEALPLVRSAGVEVRFPGTVRLAIERRAAVALVVAERDGRSLPALVDADGTIFAVARRAEEADLPVVSGLTLGTAAIGSTLGPDAVALLADLAELAARSPALYRAVSEVRLEPAGASGNAAPLGGPEFLLYLVSSPVPVRARGSLDERLLQYSLMAQELLSGQGILDDILELDFRGGEVVYRMKEG